MKIYFAGSIRGGRDHKALYLEIINQLAEYGKVLTEHIGYADLDEFGESATTDDKTIHDRDLDWVREADVLVAEVTQTSLGVGYEIAKAEEWDKPILVLYHGPDPRRLSPMIAGSRATIAHYSDPSELPQLLKRFFDNLGL
jgi:2'-deoxynucleoside 5'-phosphate N-hydrolase